MIGVRLAHYPNNEVRLTSYPVRDRGFLFGGSQDETNENDGTGEPLSPPLSLPPKPELFSQRPGYGMECRRTQFGLRGRRTIMRAGGAVDKSGFVRENCLFLTGTLAGSDEASMQTIADWSGYVVDRLKSWLSKFASNRHEFYVWELQERGALHLHYFVALEDKAVGERILEGFHREWRKLLLNVCEKSGVDIFRQPSGHSWKNDESKPRTDAQRVTHSVSAYMAKYCSKQRGSDTSRFPCPSRWWGVSRPLHTLLRSLSTVKERIFSNINSAQKWLENAYSMMCSLSDRILSYASKCGGSLVKICYHQSSEFDSVKTLLFGKTMTDFVKLRDGAVHHVGIDLKRDVSYLLGLIPACPMLTDRSNRLYRYCVERRAPLTEEELDCVISNVDSLSFIDGALNSPAYEIFMPQARVKAIATFAWTLKTRLVAARLHFFPPFSDEGTPTSEPVEMVVPSPFQQLDLGLSGKAVPSSSTRRFS